MHGQHGANGQQVDKEKQQQRHACPAPPLRLGPVGELASPKSFSKDGRKIDIGDCALFQAGNAPPFIGILRRVTVEKDQSVRLRVNWLYRPADLKLAKGVPTDAEPNEIFYSFHKDDTPAASLLHPCKVAFLRKGVELPSGVSAFVCRRVYDIRNKRLWWLTDRDYTDEHQDEVDQLLNRTKLEMQTAVQPGTPSPRTLALPHAEHAQAPSTTSKGKKRERSDAVHETTTSSKRSKIDDSESSFVKPSRPEEIASIVDKDGGLLNLAAVEKLINLMQERNDASRPAVEVPSRRIILAGVVAATEKQECKDRIVQVGGLKILDDWLQEAHKGKGGDGGSPAEGDKLSEELLLTILRALQKLPVDLDALKTCNVGKSVNNLKSHKNMDIHKRARKLVDTWKKRVDAEVKSGEKPGTPGKQDPLQSAKSTGSSTKLVSNGSTSDAPAKPVGSGSSRSATAAGSKDSSPNNSASNEVQGASVKEEKSSASQSHTWSSGCKEDVKSASKTTSVARSSAASKGDHKDTGSGKSNLCRTTSNSAAVDKVSADGSGVRTRNAERAAEKGPAEEVPSNQQRLILRIPNPGRSPARATVEAQTSSKHSSPRRLDGAEAKSKLSEAAPPEKRHKSEGKNASSVETRQTKAARENHSTATGQGQVVDGGMSLLATVAADEMLKCDGSSGSTVKSVVTEEGNEENTSPGQQEQAQQASDMPSKEADRKTDEVPSSEVKGHESQESSRKQGGDKVEEGKGGESPKEALKGEAAAVPVDDSLEVARTVAMEVEQEMQGHAKSSPKEAADQSSREVISSSKVADQQEYGEQEPEKSRAKDEKPLEAPVVDQQPEAVPCSAEQGPVEVAVATNNSRPLFDLNEGLPSEEGPDIVPLPPAPVASALTAPIPVMATTLGPFISATPPKSNSEVGWRGSAATSAFRPAEPRAPVEKKAKAALFDLNVADDDGSSSQVDMVTFLPSSSTAQAAEKMVLDLNQADETESLRFRPLPMGLNPSGVSQHRNFDLNDGPSYEDVGGGAEDSFLRGKPKAVATASASILPATCGLSGELLNLSPWCQFPAVSIPGFPPRTEHSGYNVSTTGSGPGPHPFLSSAGGPFASDLYRPSAGAGGASTSGLGGYQTNNPAATSIYSYSGYPGFPFSSTSTFVNPGQPQQQQQQQFPGSFPGIPSSHPGSAFSRPPYVLGIGDGGPAPAGAGLDNGWGRRSLDLNTDSAAAAAAAAAATMEQAYVLPLEDQLRGSAAAAGAKRKEPDSSWDAYRNGGFNKWRL